MNIPTAVKKLSEMTQPERAVAIANDVMSQILAREMLVRRGSYFTLRHPCIDDNLSCKVANSKDVLQYCEVCAKGAVTIAAALRNNDVSVSDLNAMWEHDMVKYVVSDNDIFDRDTFDMLEVAFERDRTIPGGQNLFDRHAPQPGDDGYDYDSEILPEDVGVVEGPYQWSRKCPPEWNAERVLFAIMENVVASNGTFDYDRDPNIDAVREAFANVTPKEPK